jgi:hypothetical protein
MLHSVVALSVLLGLGNKSKRAGKKTKVRIKHELRPITNVTARVSTPRWEPSIMAPKAVMVVSVEIKMAFPVERMDSPTSPHSRQR